MKCLKPELVLNFLEITTHFSPIKQRSIFSSWSQSTSFYLYKEMPFKNLCFCSLRGSPDRSVLRKKCHFFYKNLDYQAIYFSLKTCSIRTSKFSIDSFRLLLEHSVEKLLKNCPCISIFIVQYFPKQKILSGIFRFSNSCFSDNTGLILSKNISVGLFTLVEEHSIEN